MPQHEFHREISANSSRVNRVCLLRQGNPAKILIAAHTAFFGCFFHHSNFQAIGFSRSLFLLFEDYFFGVQAGSAEIGFATTLAANFNQKKVTPSTVHDSQKVTPSTGIEKGKVTPSTVRIPVVIGNAVASCQRFRAHCLDETAAAYSYGRYARRYFERRALTDPLAVVR